MSPAGAAPNVPVVAPAPTCSASAARLRGVATHHLDGLSGLGGKAADRCGHAARADDADNAHVRHLCSHLHFINEDGGAGAKKN